MAMARSICRHRPSGKTWQEGWSVIRYVSLFIGFLREKTFDVG
jgi:hypothetical protein